MAHAQIRFRCVACDSGEGFSGSTHAAYICRQLHKLPYHKHRVYRATYTGLLGAIKTTDSSITIASVAHEENTSSTINVTQGGGIGGTYCV